MHSLAFVNIILMNLHVKKYLSVLLVIYLLIFGYIQFSSVTHRVQLFATPWTAAHQASLSITISRSLLKLMSIESVTPSNFSSCHPLFLLPSIFPSIRVFSNESLFWSDFHFAKMHHFVFKDMNGILKTKQCQVYALLT